MDNPLLNLEGRLRELSGVLAAYSGGFDSAYLAWNAWRVLGPDMLAIIADSPSLARSRMADALTRVLSPQMLELLSPDFNRRGFQYVTLDCQGFRSGSMNAVLPVETLKHSHAHRLP